MTNPRHLWLAAALALAVATPAFGQAVSTGSSTTVIKLSKVMKSKVLIQEDTSAGQIVDIVISDGGCVNYYVASYEDEYYVIPYSAIAWRNNAVYVDMTPAQFKQVTFFSANNWPNLTSTTYQKQVFSTFGVNALRAEGQRSTFKADTSDAKDNAKDNAKDRRDDAKDNAKDAKDNAKDRRDDAKDNAKDNAKDRAADKPQAKEAPKPDVKKPAEKEKPNPGVIDPPKKPATPDKTPGTVPKRDGENKPGDKKPGAPPNPPKPSEKEPKKP